MNIRHAHTKCCLPPFFLGGQVLENYYYFLSGVNMLLSVHAVWVLCRQVMKMVCQCLTYDNASLQLEVTKTAGIFQHRQAKSMN